MSVIGVLTAGGDCPGLNAVKPAPEGGQHQVVLPFLDGNVPDRDGREAALHLGPLAAVAHRNEDAELGPHEQQPRLHRVLGDGPGGAAPGGRR